MSVKLISFLLLILLSTGAFCQSERDTAWADPDKVLKVVIPLGNNFSDSHIESIAFRIIADTVHSVVVTPFLDDKDYLKKEYFDSGFVQKFKFFDFSFEADRLIFKKHYSDVDPLLPNRVRFTDGMSKVDVERTYVNTEIWLCRDSTILTYIKGGNSKMSIVGAPAQFKGDLHVLEKQIADRVASSNPSSPLDSIIVFQAIVKAGEFAEMDDLEIGDLMYGSVSPFSSAVKAVLMDRSNRFPQEEQTDKPLFIDKRNRLEGNISNWKSGLPNRTGRRATTRIKIYARLNHDGIVTLKLPTKLANWGGD